MGIGYRNKRVIFLRDMYFRNQDVVYSYGQVLQVLGAEMDVSFFFWETCISEVQDVIYKILTAWRIRKLF